MTDKCRPVVVDGEGREMRPYPVVDTHAPGEYCIEWVGVDLAPDGPDKVWACVECGHTRRQGDMP